MTMKLFMCFLLIMQFNYVTAQEDETAVRFVPDRFGNSLLINRSGFNKFIPVCKGVKFEDITLIGQDFKIIKDSTGFFYIRPLRNDGRYDVLELCNKEESLGYVYGMHVQQEIFLPAYYVRDRLTFGNPNLAPSTIYFYDSLIFEYPLIRTTDGEMSFNPFNEHLYSQKPFEFVFFNIEVRYKGVIKYAEQVKGRRYSKQFLQFLDENYLAGHNPEHYKWSLPGAEVHTLIIKDVTIKDDLGNLYVLKDQSVEITARNFD